MTIRLTDIFSDFVTGVCRREIDFM